MPKSKEKTFVVYKHTCNITNKSYIGITINYEKRCKDHQKKYSGCRLFKNAINFYGWENFTHTILATGLTLHSANHFEEFFIYHFNSLSPCGYNLQSGGLNKFNSEETRKKISESNKGEKCHMFGKKGELHHNYGKRGKDNKLFGRKHKPETLIKMSISGKGRIFTKEHIYRLSESKCGEKHPFFGKYGENNPTSKMYKIIKPDGTEEIITGLSQYCRDNGLRQSAMANILCGRSKTHKKYKCEHYIEQLELEEAA
jgi:group I intron endonuclease